MATVIDTLSVAIGLDPKGAKKGAAEAQKAFKETESVVTKSAAGMAGAISGVIKEFVGLFLVIRSVQDAVHFFAELNGTIAQLGYDSKNIGESATELRTWQQVAQNFGGTAEGITASMAGIQKTLQDLRYNGVVNDQFKGFQRLGVSIADAKGDMRDYKDILEDTADALRNAGVTRPQGASLLQGLGLDQGSINAVLDAQTKGNKVIEDMYKREKASAAGTASGVEAARRLQNAWNDLKNTLTSVAAKVLNVVSPGIEKMFRGFGDWVQSHQKDISAGLKAVADWANGDGPEKIIDAFRQIGEAALDLAHFLHKWFGDEDSGDAAKDLKSTADFDQQGGVDDNKSFVGNLKRAFGNAANIHATGQYETSHGLPLGALYGLNSPGSLPTDPETAEKLLKQYQREEAKKSGSKQFDPAVNAAAWKTAIGRFRDEFQITAPNRTGLPGVVPRATPGVSRGAGAAGAGGNSTSVQIDNINVNTKATDANGIAADIGKNSARKALVNQFDPGMN